ncbi:uncharacterized protein DEA37_0007781 [Paragonimus westermani]|uniref:Trematode PH-like domain-containing protein n=1 Tax=Paragonimus westermani TaxID=34504 RepID=A0A5J4N4E7_9TREM|nr:uncharacterized protein DEA37_0007781 [Paragonimus westermani]
MPSRKNRNLDDGGRSLGPRNLSSPNVQADTLDRKTRQQLFYECHACILGRTKLQKEEPFTQTKAEVLMNRQYGKRQSHCVLYCLEDSIRFEKTKLLGIQPLRNFVQYKSIKHVFIFEEKADAFMLCIDSGRSDRRTYEGFKCKRKEDVLAICDLIYKASQDPEHLLRDMVPIRDVSRYSDLSIPIRYHSATEVRHSTHPTHSLSDMTLESSAIRLDSVAPEDYTRLRHVDVMRPTFDEEQLCKEFYGEKNIQHQDLIYNPTVCATNYTMLNSTDDAVKRGSIKAEILREKLERKLSDDSWEVSVTYLQWDNVHGAVINDCGPIYMYIARHLRTGENGY